MAQSVSALHPNSFQESECVCTTYSAAVLTYPFSVSVVMIEPESSPPLPTPTPLSTGLLVGLIAAVVALVVGGLTTVSVALCFMLKKKQKQLAMAQR